MSQEDQQEEYIEEYISFTSESNCSNCIYCTFNSDFRCAVNPTYNGEYICNDYNPNSDSSTTE